MIETKIVDKITLAGKTKSKEKEDESNKGQEIYIPPKKKTVKYWSFEIVLEIEESIKIEYQKIINLLDTTSDNLAING